MLARELGASWRDHIPKKNCFKENGYKTLWQSDVWKIHWTRTAPSDIKTSQQGNKLDSVKRR